MVLRIKGVNRGRGYVAGRAWRKHATNYEKRKREREGQRSPPPPPPSN